MPDIKINTENNNPIMPVAPRPPAKPRAWLWVILVLGIWFLAQGKSAQAATINCDQAQSCRSNIGVCTPAAPRTFACTGPNPSCTNIGSADCYDSGGNIGDNCTQGDICDPGCDLNTGQTCASSPNNCGATSAGTIQCDGACSASPPADEPNYGNSCTSAPNNCSATSAGTIKCDGACSATAPADEDTLGDPCVSAPNNCGETNIGTILCGGSCSAAKPADKNLGACTSSANSCGMTAAGSYRCDGSCSAIPPSNSLCPPPCTDTCPSGDFSGSCTDGKCCSTSQGNTCNDSDACTANDLIQCDGSCKGSNNPVDGGWSAWSACVGGTQTRTCNNPAQSCGGATCAGPASQTCTVGGAVCGNGTPEPGESCDQGSNNGACPKTCSTSCTVNICTACNPSNANDPICDDQNNCTSDSCNSSGRCQNSPSCFSCNYQPSQPVGSQYSCGSTALTQGYQNLNLCNNSCIGTTTPPTTGPICNDGICYTTPPNGCTLTGSKTTCQEINNGANHYYETTYTGTDCNGVKYVISANVCVQQNCSTTSSVGGIYYGPVQQGSCFGGDNSTVTGPVCSNKTLESGEQCDDGNLNNGDGCSSTCQFENAMYVNSAPVSQDVCRGNSTSYAISASYTGANITNAKFTITGCPAGATCTFQGGTNTVTRAFNASKQASATLNVSTNSSAAIQNNALNVKVEDAACAGQAGCRSAASNAGMNVLNCVGVGTINVRYTIDGVAQSTNQTINYAISGPTPVARANYTVNSTSGYTTRNAGNYTFAYYSGAPAGKIPAPTNFITTATTQNLAGGSFITFTLNFVSPPRPDLIVQNLAIRPASPAQGQTVSFDAQVKNQGGAVVGGTSQTRLRIDINNNGSYDTITPAPPNQSTGNLGISATENETWNNAWTNVPAGTHKFEVCADATNQRAETDDTNNCATQVFTVSGPPSGTIQVRYATNGVIGGMATYSTGGYNLTGPTPYTCTGGTCTIGRDHTGMQAGSYTFAYTGSNTPSGTVRATPFITPSISQTLSAGGTITFTVNFVSPPRPDLIVQNLAIRPASPAQGQTVSFDAQVKNQGGAVVGGTSQTRLRIDINNNGSYDTITPAPPNQSTGNLGISATENETWNNAWTNVPAGTHKFEVCADATNQRAETDDTNNCTTQVFTVSGIANQAPVANATISTNGTAYSDIITVTQGVATPVYLAAISAAGTSVDPDGWTSATFGMSGGGARCEWNRDLNQGAPTFELPAITNPVAPANCNISLGNLTFNDAAGTYTYQVLRLTDRAGGISNVDTVQVTVQTPPGTINVRYTIDGTAQSANQSIDYSISGPTPVLSGNKTVSNTSSHTGRAAGDYTFTYNSGAPAGKTFSSVTPPSSQILSAGGAITFTVNFISPPRDPGNGAQDPCVENGTNICGGGVGAACQTLKINWSDNSNNEQGFYVYRNSAGNSPTAAERIATLGPNSSANMTYTYTPPDNNPYYYFVSAFNAGGESGIIAADNNPVASVECEANLSSSDKDITALQGLVFTPSACNGAYESTPAAVKFLESDLVSFRVNICNNSVTSQDDATSVVVTDYLTNLVQPTTGWQARLCDPSASCNNINPTVSGSAPNQTLTFNVGTVPKGQSRYITLNAEIAASSGPASRFNNRAVIDYIKDDKGTPGNRPASIPWLPYYSAQGAPSRGEIPAQ